MTPGEWTNLLSAIAAFIAACVWPGIVIYLLIGFRPEIKKLLERTSSVKTPVFEAAFATQRAEAVASLTAAATTKGTASDASAARDVATVVSQTVTPTAMSQLPGARVLWVDDHPENNVHERQSMEALGIQFILSTSTDDAIARLKDQSFDAVISDLGRGPDRNAGYTLLEEATKLRPEAPVIFYAGTRAVQERETAKQRGAFGSTNNPQELFQLVVRAIQSKPARAVRPA
jgi:CheY-like chemotaxis protein